MFDFIESVYDSIFICSSIYFDSINTFVPLSLSIFTYNNSFIIKRQNIYLTAALH